MESVIQIGTWKGSTGSLLAERELTCLLSLASGMTDKEIARRDGLSPKHSSAGFSPMRCTRWWCSLALTQSSVTIRPCGPAGVAKGKSRFVLRPGGWRVVTQHDAAASASGEALSGAKASLGEPGRGTARLGKVRRGKGCLQRSASSKSWLSGGDSRPRSGKAWQGRARLGSAGRGRGYNVAFSHFARGG